MNQAKNKVMRSQMKSQMKRLKLQKSQLKLSILTKFSMIFWKIIQIKKLKMLKIWFNKPHLLFQKKEIQKKIAKETFHITQILNTLII